MSISIVAFSVVTRFHVWLGVSPFSLDSIVPILEHFAQLVLVTSATRSLRIAARTQPIGLQVGLGEFLRYSPDGSRRIVHVPHRGWPHAACAFDLA